MAFSHYSIECLPAHIREGTLDKRVQIMFTQELNFEGGKKPTNQELHPDQGKMHLISMSWHLLRSFQSIQAPQQ